MESRWTWKLGVLTFAFAFTLAGCGGGGDGEEPEDEATEEEAVEGEDLEDMTEDPMADIEPPVDDEETVAIVYDKEIMGSEFNNQYMLQQMMYAQTGINLEEDEEMRAEVEQNILNSLIGQELVLFEAREEGYEADEEEVEEQIEMTKGQFESEEDFQEVLDQEGFTEEEFREQVIQQSIYTQYMEDKISVEVTEEDIEQYLEEQQDGPLGDISEEELEDLKPMVEEQLAQMQQGEKSEQLLDELRDKHEDNIEILI